jgi:hypothetical protein
MCYENRFFKSWAKPKVQQREQMKPESERALQDVRPIHPASEREITRPREVARGVEEIV